jgi:antitoxin MazE
MQGIIQKWGNSNAVRLPKPLLESVGLRENDHVKIVQSGNSIIIKGETKFIHKSLKQRIKEAGSPSDFQIASGELDAASVGDEVFW